MIKVLGISGSPRANGNTDTLLKHVLHLFEREGFSTEFVALRDLRIDHCRSCRKCLSLGMCVVEDDMIELGSRMVSSHVIVIATPVHFDNVSSLTKTFMDRTWWLRGRLSYRIGLAIAVGRGYGLDLAIAEVHSFMLKHGMVLCHRGIRARAFEIGEVLRDAQALRDAEDAVRRVSMLARAIWEGAQLQSSPHQFGLGRPHHSSPQAKPYR